MGTSGGVLYCLGAASGSIVWRAPANGGITAAPLLSGNIVYVGCMDKTLYAYDAATGTVPWKFAVDGRITSSPVASKQSLFLLVEDRTVMALKHGDTK